MTTTSVSDYAFNDTRLKQLHSPARVVGGTACTVTHKATSVLDELPHGDVHVGHSLHVRDAVGSQHTQPPASPSTVPPASLQFVPRTNAMMDPGVGVRDVANALPSKAAFEGRTQPLSCPHTMTAASGVSLDEPRARPERERVVKSFKAQRKVGFAGIPLSSTSSASNPTTSHIYDGTLIGDGGTNVEGSAGIDLSAGAKPKFVNQSRTNYKVLLRAKTLAKKQLVVTQDWQFDPEEFKFWEGETKTFTLDACCDNAGENTLVAANYNTPNNSFLKSDCTGNHVWMSPPFVNATPFLRHFETCRQMEPSTTSVVIILPAWTQKEWAPYLDKYRLLHQYPAGRLGLFTTPDPLNPGKRIEIVPTKYQVNV